MQLVDHPLECISYVPEVPPQTKALTFEIQIGLVEVPLRF